MKSLKHNQAVSEVLGAVLLLLIATVVMSVIYLGVLSDTGAEQNTYVKIAGFVDGTNLIMQHNGGENLDLDTLINFTLAGEQYEYQVGELLLDENNDYQWNLGERLIYHFDVEMSRLDEYVEIDTMAVDDDSNSIVLMGPIDINLVSDVGMSISVNNTNPEPYSKIQITITVTSFGGDVDGSGNVSVRFQLPENLIHVSNYSSSGHGSFSHATGLWKIGNIMTDNPAELKINVTVQVVEIRELMQLAMVLDGSGSISSTDWDIMVKGLSRAVKNEDVFPHDGTVELTVVQFGTYPNNHCTVEISPTIVNESNYISIANTIEYMDQGDGGTPMAAGIYLASDTMENSVNYNPSLRQVINLVTDGKPTYYSNEGEYIGLGDGYYTNSIDLETTEQAKNYSVNNLALTEDKDEFNALAVGSGPDIEWLNGSIVWPGPGVEWDIETTETPPGPGWVANIDSYADFEFAIEKMFKVYFNSIPVTVEYIGSSTIDPNDLNDLATISILPED